VYCVKVTSAESKVPNLVNAINGNISARELSVEFISGVYNSRTFSFIIKGSVVPLKAKAMIRITRRVLANLIFPARGSSSLQ